MPVRSNNEPTNINAASEATRTASVVTDGASHAGQEAVRAGSDMARRGAETAQQAFKSGLDTATQSFQRVTDQVTQVLGFSGPQAEELARRSSQNLEAVKQANTVLAQGFQEISRDWFGLVQARVTKNLDAMSQLARCRSVQDFVAVQSDLVRDNMQQIISGSRQIAEVSVRVANEAARTIQAQVQTNNNVERTRSAA
jgi:phasin family protein